MGEIRHPFIVALWLSIAIGMISLFKIHLSIEATCNIILSLETNWNVITLRNVFIAKYPVSSVVEQVYMHTTPKLFL